MIKVGYEYYFADSGALMSGKTIARNTIKLKGLDDLHFFDIQRMDAPGVVKDVSERAIFSDIEKAHDYCRKESERWMRYEDNLADIMAAEEITEEKRRENEAEFAEACHDESMAQLEREER